MVCKERFRVVEPCAFRNEDAEQMEMSFHSGDIIIVFDDMDDDGFYMGHKEETGERG
jgi:hypothetical protein